MKTNTKTSQTMTTNERPAAVARALTGAGTAIALISMVTAFQISAAVAEQQAQAEAIASPTVAATNVRAQAVRVLDPSLLPEIVAAAPVAAPSTNSSSSSGSTAAAPAAPAAPAPAPAPAQPAPPANGTTAGSGG